MKGREGRPLRRLIRRFAPHRLEIGLAALGTIFFGLVNSAVALVIAGLMDLFAGAGALTADAPFLIQVKRALGGFVLYDITLTSRDQARTILLYLVAGTVGLVLLQALFHFVKEYLLWRATYGVLTQLKADLFRKVIHLPTAHFDRGRSGDILARITYDASQLEGAIRAGINVTKSVFYTFLYVGMMFLMAWPLALMALAVFPLSALAIKQFGGRMRRAAGRLSQNVADYTSYLSEAIAGARVIKAFGRESTVLDAFSAKLKENYRWGMKGAKYASLHNPTQEAISTVGLAVLLLFCGWRILTGAMSIGDLTGFVVLLVNAYKPIKDLGEINSVLARASASSSRIDELLASDDEADVVRGGDLRPDLSGKVEFQGIEFGYRTGEPPVLRGLDLTIQPGETVALVGPSGSGKSTLLSLLLHFYPLERGMIRFDGHDVTRIDTAYLRSRIAIVPQETLLFAGTIEENIRFGRTEATLEEVVAAAIAANAETFIKRLPDGFASQTGERGVQLSGGERQRIAIARAILKNPAILLLDEATSSLDTESEALVRDALDRLRQGRTTLVIAHRLSTVQSADRIVVLSEGRIAEEGAHRELLERKGIYARLWEQGRLNAE